MSRAFLLTDNLCEIYHSLILQFCHPVILNFTGNDVFLNECMSSIPSMLLGTLLVIQLEYIELNF